jgi:hypothetical protein
VQQSEAKQAVWMNKIQELEAEKYRLETETENLKQAKNYESESMQQRLH